MKHIGAVLLENELTLSKALRQFISFALLGVKGKQMLKEDFKKSKRSKRNFQKKQRRKEERSR